MSHELDAIATPVQRRRAREVLELLEGARARHGLVQLREQLGGEAAQVVELRAQVATLRSVLEETRERARRAEEQSKPRRRRATSTVAGRK